MKLTRDFYRPSADNAVIEVIDGIPGSEVVRYEANGSPLAAVFGGKRSKPDWHFRFKSVERMEAKIQEWIDDQKARAASAAARRAAKNGGHSLKVGDVLHSSWGYDQTNADFYQVVEVPSKCFVIARRIGSETVSGHGESYTHVRPVKDAFVGEPKRYKSGKENSIRVRSYSNASQTDWESTHYETGFGYGH